MCLWVCGGWEGEGNQYTRRRDCRAHSVDNAMRKLAKEFQVPMTHDRPPNSPTYKHNAATGIVQLGPSLGLEVIKSQLNHQRELKMCKHKFTTLRHRITQNTYQLQSLSSENHSDNPLLCCQAATTGNPTSVVYYVKGHSNAVQSSATHNTRASPTHGKDTGDPGSVNSRYTAA